ncbi:hypothetical protein Moror_581 [Moniliophthora roreri MCA 2997]|uniref:SigF-like NTF2-like domain-containing protein n=2 Tax=Moniliophthora roreri TaxID=221103 RepID=V2XZC0_MONRO|nr:hypothetical protein Moror_581 [Moniliophthora roreri MCA 2997]KAI3598089.1 hypothetical protein WG66_009083 [Moniliophthora roreri]
MQNPAEEITSVISRLTTTTSPEVQKATAEEFLTPNVGFRHPICSVSPGPGSRDALLGIYQWYRIMSPTIEAHVESVVYDAENEVVFAEVRQKFHIRISPFKPAWSRLIVRLELREMNGRRYIAFQEDFYHPDDFMNLILPPIAPIIRLALSGATIGSNLNAKIGQLLGFWRPNNSTATNSQHHDTRALYDGNKTD